MWKKWDIPAGIATVVAATITALSGVVVYLFTGNGPRTNRRKNSVIEKAEIDATVKSVLEWTLVNLEADQILLLKYLRPVRPDHAMEDRRGNGMVVVSKIARHGIVESGGFKYVPFARKVSSDHYAHEFQEQPDRMKLPEDSLMRLYLKNIGMRALLAYRLKNSEGEVIGVLDAFYTEARGFTELDRDTMRARGRQLQLVLPWLVVPKVNK